MPNSSGAGVVAEARLADDDRRRLVQRQRLRTGVGRQAIGEVRC